MKKCRCGTDVAVISAITRKDVEKKMRKSITPEFWNRLKANLTYGDDAIAKETKSLLESAIDATKDGFRERR